MSWLRKNLVVLVLIVLGALVLGFSPILTPVHAAISADEPVESCPMWRVAGTNIVYRCEDETTGIICFSQGIMLFCVTP